MKLLDLIPLFEAVDLDFPKIYATYGSWMHPKLRTPVFATNEQTHMWMAHKILQKADPKFIQELKAGATMSVYGKMFELGWVRVVHNKLHSIQFSGYKEALANLFPLIATIRNATTSINLDIEKCTSEKGCNTVSSMTYEMPGQWNDMRRAVQ